jgi:hypothetical protein
MKGEEKTVRKERELKKNVFLRSLVFINAFLIIFVLNE